MAKKLLAVCLAGQTPVDWKEVERLAALPSYSVTEELNELRIEVARERGSDA